MHQGKFLKVDKFDIFDIDLRRSYEGKIFLFEKSIIFTEIIDKTKLQFRGYLTSTTIGVAFEEGKSKIILYKIKRGNQEMECSADAKIITNWTDLLKKIVLKNIRKF